MNYNIRGENIEVTPALKDHVERKIGKLERYFDHSVDADVNVNLKFYNDKESKVAYCLQRRHKCQSHNQRL